MGQFNKVLLAIDKVHTVSQRALDCRPDLSGLNKVYAPNCPTISVYSICGKYIDISIFKKNISTSCTNRN